MTKEEYYQIRKQHEDRNISIDKLITICDNENIDFTELIKVVSEICIKGQIQKEELRRLFIIIHPEINKMK